MEVLYITPSFNTKHTRDDREKCATGLLQTVYNDADESLMIIESHPGLQIELPSTPAPIATIDYPPLVCKRILCIDWGVVGGGAWN